MSAARGVVGALCVLAVLTCAVWSCSGGRNATARVDITDSASIEIVSNVGSPENVPQWRTETELTIGQQEGPEEYTFGQVTDVDVDRRGRLFVLDRLARVARVYGPDGRFLFRFGGPGEGPGEFGQMAFQVRVGPLDSIMVLDAFQMRLNVFAPDGTPDRVVHMRFGRGGGPFQFRRLDDGRLLVRWLAYNLEPDGRFVTWDVLLVSDPAQTTFDTLMQFDYRPSDVGNVGELRHPLITNVAFWDLLGDGTIAWSALERAEITVDALDGSPKRIIRNRRWRRHAASSADREDLIAAYRTSSRGFEGPVPHNIVLPDSIPTITALHRTPDGGFWVQRMGPVSEVDPEALTAEIEADWLGGRTWEVYDRDGRWEATVELPSRFHVTRVLDSAVVGIQRDSLDVERVMLLRVLR